MSAKLSLASIKKRKADELKVKRIYEILEDIYNNNPNINTLRDNSDMPNEFIDHIIEGCVTMGYIRGYTDGEKSSSMQGDKR